MLERSATPDTTIPHELAKTTTPSYRIEPPDILLIDAIKIIPKEPYVIEPLDLLTVQVEGTPDESPIPLEQRVNPSGKVNLGPGYGLVEVEGLTTGEAEEKIREALSKILVSPEVSVGLAEPAARQNIAGEHLVNQDGTISLGIYGAVRVVGLTIHQARDAIEKQLSEFLEDPQVAVDISSYNSKVFYLILQGGGEPDSVARWPYMGNETVLDVIGQIDGFSASQSTNIWIARPSPSGSGCDQILPVNWNALIEGGETSTNYQLLPGDRLFVGENKVGGILGLVNRATLPFERIFGVTLLGTQMMQQIDRSPTGFRGTPPRLNPAIILQ